MDHLIVNGLASPVSLSLCHPELGAKAPGPKAVEGAGRLTSGLGKRVISKTGTCQPCSSLLLESGTYSSSPVSGWPDQPSFGANPSPFTTLAEGESSTTGALRTLGTVGACNSPFTGSPCHRPFATNPLAVANLVWFGMVWCGLVGYDRNRLGWVAMVFIV